MEQTPNEEFKLESRRRKRRKKSPLPFSLHVPAFLTHLGEDVNGILTSGYGRR